MDNAHSPPNGASDLEALWYLAYGSNMKSSSMASRDVVPIAAKVVHVPTHYFTFDIFGIPYSEPCYASIEQFPNQGQGQLQLIHNKECFNVPSLYGVAYLLSPSDFHRLLITEGSGVVYDLVKVDAYEHSERKAEGASEKKLAAYTLKAKWPQRPNGTPSARYLNLFLEGAKENDLPGHYISYLESFPRYRKLEGKDRSYGQLIFDIAWRPFLRRIVLLTTWRVDENGNCPILIGNAIVWLYQFMWFYHDYIHCSLFGRGDGGKLVYRG